MFRSLVFALVCLTSPAAAQTATTALADNNLTVGAAPDLGQRGAQVHLDAKDEQVQAPVEEATKEEPQKQRWSMETNRSGPYTAVDRQGLPMDPVDRAEEHKSDEPGIRAFSVTDPISLYSDEGDFGDSGGDADEDSFEEDSLEEEGPDHGSDDAYEPPDDVFDIGYNDWFDDRLGRDFSDREIEYGLGLHYNEYFDEKLDSYSPEYKGPDSIYAGRYPGYLSNGLQTFRTIGPWTTRMYAAGYYGGKLLGYSLKAGAVILTLVPRKIPYKERATRILMKYASSKLPDGLGEVASAYGNLFDNTDVVGHNVRRMFEIVEDPETYRSPFSPWPPLH